MLDSQFIAAGWVANTSEASHAHLCDQPPPPPNTTPPTPSFTSSRRVEGGGEVTHAENVTLSRGSNLDYVMTVGRPPSALLFASPLSIFTSLKGKYNTASDDDNDDVEEGGGWREEWGAGSGCFRGRCTIVTSPVTAR